MDRDKRVAAAVLSGGLAFRFFFWALALFVFVTGGLGIGDGNRVAKAVSTSGLDPELAKAIVDSWESTQDSQWWLLLVGGWLLLWTGYLAVKALVLVHAAAQYLPHAAEVDWRAMAPGAVLFAVGVQALHLFTVFYLSPKLHHSTELYAVLGIVATVLFWLYMTGRLVVGAATLNASLHEQRLLAAGTTPEGLPEATPARTSPSPAPEPILTGDDARVIRWGRGQCAADDVE